MGVLESSKCLSGKIVVAARLHPGQPLAEARRREGVVAHRVDVQRSVTYSVVTRGPVTASVQEFARLAQQTYDDPRGWRGGGVAFRRVTSGGSFTPVLATAEQAVFDLVAAGLASEVVLGDDPESEQWRSQFMYSRAATIYGGSAEIQRNIVARRLLDLGPDR